MGNAQIHINYPPILTIFYNLEHGKMVWRDDASGRIRFAKRDAALYGCGGEITFQLNNQSSGQFFVINGFILALDGFDFSNCLCGELILGK